MEIIAPRFQSRLQKIFVSFQKHRKEMYAYNEYCHDLLILKLKRRDSITFSSIQNTSYRQTVFCILAKTCSSWPVMPFALFVCQIFLGEPDQSEAKKHTRGSPYFVQELAYLLAHVEEKIPFVQLAAEVGVYHTMLSTKHWLQLKMLKVGLSCES
jgi:hypothetical protein